MAKDHDAIFGDQQKLDIEIIRCPSCAGALEYTPGAPMITCKFCKNQYSFQYEADVVKMHEYSEKQRKKFGHLIDDDTKYSLADNIFNVYVSECPSCGETIENRKFISGKCPACDCAYTGNFSNADAGIQPTIVYPFVTRPEEVLRKFRLWYRFSIHRILFFMRLKFDKKEQISPYYYPVWMFNAKAHIKYKGEVTPSPVSEKKEVSGEFEAEINRIPIHALPPTENKLAGYVSHFLEWDLSSPKKFHPALIAGIKSKSFIFNESNIIPRASDELIYQVKEKIKEDMGGAHQEISDWHANFSSVECTPALIPVWMAVTSSKNKPVWFCMNGLSGKYIARSPSPSKQSVWTLGIFLSVFFTVFAGYLQDAAGIFKFGTMIFAAIFSIFTVSALLAGLQKIFSMKMSLWLAVGVDLFYLVISFQHIKTMFWYHVAVFGFIGLVLLLWRLSTSDLVDESDFDEDTIENLA